MTTKKKSAKKKTKKKKLTPKPRIRRRLLRLWSDQCLTANNYTCIICGARKKKEDEEPDGKFIVVKVDAHHIVGKEIKNSFFRYHLWNAACLCPKCHKFGNNSAHRNAVFFINFIMTNFPERFEYLLKHNDVRIDLDNREVLAEIESKLKAGLPLDLEIIREIEKKAEEERLIKETKKAETEKEPDFDGSLFDEIENDDDEGDEGDDTDESSSSENYLDLG